MLHRLDAGEIKRLMLERGYSAYKLAKAVGIDAKTLRRWLDGEAAQTENVARLAETLGTVPSALIAKDSAASEEPRKERRIPGIILRWEVEIPEANMSSPQVADFLTKLAATISALSPIILLAVGQGSLLLTVDMSEHDLISMLKRFAFGRLDGSGISQISFPSAMTKSMLRARRHMDRGLPLTQEDYVAISIDSLLNTLDGIKTSVVDIRRSAREGIVVDRKPLSAQDGKKQSGA